MYQLINLIAILLMMVMMWWAIYQHRGVIAARLGDDSPIDG